MPAPEFFEFDVKRLTHYDPARMRQALRDHPAVYVNHLQVAAWIQQWAVGLEQRPPLGAGDNGDFVKALHEIAAHLRQADLVPDGILLAEMNASIDAELDEAHRRESRDG